MRGREGLSVWRAFNGMTMMMEVEDKVDNLETGQTGQTEVNPALDAKMSGARRKGVRFRGWGGG